MKVNELRIGNYIKYNGTHEELGYISEIQSHLYPLNQNKIGINERIDIYYSIEKLKPIKITKEWLLKFGFSESNLDEDNSWLNLKYRFLNFSSDESVFFNKVYLSINKMDIICNYVHELQNLYFALTGKELYYESKKV